MNSDTDDSLPADHFEWHVRCLKRDHQKVPSRLLEALSLEQSPSEQSPVKKRTRPLLDRRPLYYTTEFAGDITALQAGSIMHDAEEMHRAYVDSDVGSASGSLNSHDRSSSDEKLKAPHQSTVTKCGCDCGCDKITVRHSKCRGCAQNRCGHEGDGGPMTESKMEFPDTINDSMISTRRVARVVVLSPTGHWIVESQSADIYDTESLSLLRFTADDDVDVQQAIIDGLNAMLTAPDLSLPDLCLLPSRGVQGQVCGDLYLVQLRDGALVSTTTHLLHSEPRDLSIHRSSSMHLRDALGAAKAWATAQTETEDFRSARRGEKNTRD